MVRVEDMLNQFVGYAWSLLVEHVFDVSECRDGHLHVQAKLLFCAITSSLCDCTSCQLKNAHNLRLVPFNFCILLQMLPTCYCMFTLYYRRRQTWCIVPNIDVDIVRTPFVLSTAIASPGVVWLVTASSLSEIIPPTLAWSRERRWHGHGRTARQEESIRSHPPV
ncbi:unnamed protein product [Prorocentrum cordatum]|uniref:Uncharacterized protein n=1 Tax=Prorocentrum cordatum TaxID=2364126 RepID=A0ABN9UWA0_9DINO|nr:unnamed protein product [Polarella glacialis]